MDNIKFGKFIKEVRREKDMIQKQLAGILHVSDKAVSKWENGIGFPDIKLLEPLAEACFCGMSSAGYPCPFQSGSGMPSQ